MKKIILFAFMLVAVASVAVAGNYRLPLDGTGKHAVQGHAGQSAVTRSLGTGGQAVFKNISTNGVASIRCTGRTTAGVATVVKVRPGGFSTGVETDVYPTDVVELYNPPTKVGFWAYSTANSINIHCTK